MIRLSLVLIAVLVFGNWPAYPQDSNDLQSLRKEFEALKEDQQALQRELQAIKELLRARLAPQSAEVQNVSINLAGHPFKGKNDAPLTLVEFSDYQCPFCARHARETFAELERDYIATGKVKYVFRDFPIEAIHRDAIRAAEAARCAGEQGRYWEMHDRLFNNQEKLDSDQLSGHAKTLGLEVKKFDDCLDTLKYAGEVRNSVAEGIQVGVRGTPTFFLGETVGTGAVNSWRIIRGAQRFPAFKEAIDALLSSPR